MNIKNQQAKANSLKKIEPVLVAIALVSALLLLLSMTTVAQIVGADPRELIRGTRQNMARNPETVQFISKRSPFFISLLVKPERLQTFSQLATNPSDRGKLRHQLDFFKQQLRQNWLLDYEKDIQPWLDQEITIAKVDLIKDAYLLAMTAKSPQLAQQGLEKLWRRLALTGSDLRFEQYQGVVIAKVLPPEDHRDRPTIVGASLGKFVVFAQDVAVLHDAIDNLRSPSLAIIGLDSYRDRLEQINQSPKNNNKSNEIAIAYLNFERTLEPNDMDSSPVNLLVGLGLERDRLVANTFFESLCNQFDSSKMGADISCLQGKYNLRISPSSYLGANIWQHFDWLLTANTKSQLPEVTPAIAHLDVIARNYFTVGTVAIGDQPATVWADLAANPTGVAGKVVAVHTQTPNQIIFSNSLVAISSALQTH